jgi:hypothetical protein
LVVEAMFGLAMFGGTMFSLAMIDCATLGGVSG